MRTHRYTLFIFFVLLLPATVFSRTDDLQRSIQWTGKQLAYSAEGLPISYLAFKGSVNEEERGFLPWFSETFALQPGIRSSDQVIVSLKNIVTEVLSESESSLISFVDPIGFTYHLDTRFFIESKKAFFTVSWLPLMRDEQTGRLKKVVSFVLSVTQDPSKSSLAVWDTTQHFTHHSILATGQWYKLAIKETGIHKLSYTDLQNMGINMTTLDPLMIRIYGNKGGMVPERNEDARPDDLLENAILVAGEEDGHFDTGDYVVFYAQGADSWAFDPVTQFYDHARNYYADENYVFFNADLGLGKRVGLESSPTQPPTFYVNKFNDHVFHELATRNLIQSGKIWYGEQFDADTSEYAFMFHFPDIDKNSLMRVKTYVAANAPATSWFHLYRNNILYDSISINATDPASTTIAAQFRQQSRTFSYDQPDFGIRIRYEQPTPNSIAWLRFLEVNAIRSLRFHGGQMEFRDTKSVGLENIAEFTIKGANPDLRVLDVTVPSTIALVKTTITDSVLSFRMPTEYLKEYIAFDGTSYYRPTFAGTIDNQDIHAFGPADLVIVSHPLFLAAAEELAGFHREVSGLSVVVTSPDKIYNEFSSGRQDPSAIRDFVRMLYERSDSGSQPRYLLLFGDGSYDPKNRTQNNTNFIPAFQSEESLKHTYSYVTDDYYGILDPGEGKNSSGALDVGIGRLPAKTEEEALNLVRKIIYYKTASDSTLNDWRNNICFVADDGNKNVHMNQAEELALITNANYPEINVDKIYLDAYTLEKIPGGSSYPEAKAALNKCVQEGALIINYTGHGGEDAWSDEKVLEIQDINNWTNLNNLPVFVTATCEFSRFDNPARVSAGEMVLLSPKGGGVALYTTTRLAFSTSNFRLDTSFFHNLFPPAGQPARRMGDLIKMSKNRNHNNSNILNFVLLGDPALELATPVNKVTTTAVLVNGRENSSADTLKGLSLVTVRGVVENEAKEPLTSFNGTLNVKVFDKTMNYRTRGNASGSFPQEFHLRNVLVYKGKVTVMKGNFEFSFRMPKDIALGFGQGKISYYADNDSIDAHGYDTGVVIGGTDLTAPVDQTGPGIKLFMNDEHFNPGGTTGRNPVLLGRLTDENGLNFLGSGIGHDIVATLDNSAIETYTINDYFNPDTDSYTAGWVIFPYRNLNYGWHQVRLTAWDVFNNQGSANLEFVVSASPEMSSRRFSIFPNPMKDGTTFIFSHNVKEGTVSAEISIYTLTGQRIKMLTENLQTGPNVPASIHWDGLTDNGSRISGGAYLCVLKLSANGTFSLTSGKIIVLN